MVEWWTSAEAAQYLGVSKSFVDRLCRDGVLNCSKRGRDWLIDPQSVAAYAQAPKDKGGRPAKAQEER